MQLANALLFEFGDHEIEAGRLLPGRLSRGTRPNFTGSSPAKKTIGMVEVAALAAMPVAGRPGDDHGNPALDQIRRQRRQSIEVIISPAILGRKVAALDKAHLVQAARDSNQKSRRSVGCATIEEADQRQGALLRARRRPSQRDRAARSGPCARPMEKARVYEVRRQCPANGVTFFFKQLGWTSGGRKLDGHEWSQFPRLAGLAEMAAE